MKAATTSGGRFVHAAAGTSGFAMCAAQILLLDHDVEFDPEANDACKRCAGSVRRLRRKGLL